MLGWYDPELRDWFGDLVIENWFSDELVGAAATSGVTATLNVTLANATLTGEADVSVSAALAVTLANATLSGTANVINPVIGTLALTLDDVTLSGTATVTTPSTTTGPGMNMWNWAVRREEEVYEYILFNDVVVQ